MQYILTEQEYRALTPISEVDKLKEDVQLLNEKVMELSEHPCGSDVDYRSVTFIVMIARLVHLVLVLVQRDNNILNSYETDSRRSGNELCQL